MRAGRAPLFDPAGDLLERADALATVEDYANLQVTRELSTFPAPSLEQVGRITMLAVRWPNLVRDFTTTSGPAIAIATLEALAERHRTITAWSTAAKKAKGLPGTTCAALLRADIHTFLRQGPSIADYADEFL